MRQLPLELHELVCDSFAGGGGASTGIEAGIGRAADFAKEQIRTHARAARAAIQEAHLRHVAGVVRDIQKRREVAALLRRARECNTIAGEPPCVS